MDLINTLTIYTQKLTSLRRGGVAAGLAPHKPIFLLSLIDLIEQEGITVNAMPIANALFEQFSINWKLLVPNSKVGDINQPIYHLQKEGFWYATRKDGNILEGKLSSTKQALKHLGFGQLKEDLFQLVIHSTYRPIIKTILLDRYFPETKAYYLKAYAIPTYISELEEIILEERLSQKRRITKIEEGFVRDWKFRQYVMELYDYTCCISRLRIEPSYSIIEACHIQPHAQFGIDTITNGIPLCVNLHRAFDNGLISLNDNYQILVKGRRIFKENDSPYSIQQFNGKSILLPALERFYPSLESIKWHRNEYGF